MAEHREVYVARRGDKLVTVEKTFVMDVLQMATKSGVSEGDESDDIAESPSSPIPDFSPLRAERSDDDEVRTKRPRVAKDEEAEAYLIQARNIWRSEIRADVQNMIREAAAEAREEAAQLIKYEFRSLRDEVRQMATGTEVPETKAATSTEARVPAKEALELLRDHVIGTRGEARPTVPSQHFSHLDVQIFGENSRDIEKDEILRLCNTLGLHTLALARKLLREYPGVRGVWWRASEFRLHQTPAQGRRVARPKAPQPRAPTVSTPMTVTASRSSGSSFSRVVSVPSVTSNTHRSPAMLPDEVMAQREAAAFEAGIRAAQQQRNMGYAAAYTPGPARGHPSTRGRGRGRGRGSTTPWKPRGR